MDTNLDPFLDKIVCGDCLALLRQLPAESIDLVVTSPPYNVNLGRNKYHKNPYDLYRDNREHSEYIEWLKTVFAEVQRVLKHGGRVAINIGDGKNGAIPTHADVIQVMTKDLGYLPMATLIWNKNQTSPRTAWGSWMSPSCPSFPMPFEYVLIFAKGTTKKPGDKKKITVTKEEFVTNSLALWTISPESRQKKFGHHAMFPVELPHRLIQQLSYRDDVVLDIFAGVGTTAIAAKRLGRRFICFELSPEYCKTATQRLEEEDQ